MAEEDDEDAITFHSLCFPGMDRWSAAANMTATVMLGLCDFYKPVTELNLSSPCCLYGLSEQGLVS